MAAPAARDGGSDQDAGRRAASHRFSNLRPANTLDRLVGTISGIEVAASGLAEDLFGLDVELAGVVIANHDPDGNDVGLRHVPPEMLDLLYEAPNGLGAKTSASAPHANLSRTARS